MLIANEIFTNLFDTWRLLILFYVFGSNWYFVGIQPKGQISERAFHKNKARKIFRKTKIFYPLIRTHTSLSNLISQIKLTAFYTIIKKKNKTISISLVYVIQLASLPTTKGHCYFLHLRQTQSKWELKFDYNLKDLAFISTTFCNWKKVIECFEVRIDFSSVPLPPSSTFKLSLD